jgi:hypothetical protein
LVALASSTLLSPCWLSGWGGLGSNGRT